MLTNEGGRAMTPIQAAFAKYCADTTIAIVDHDERSLESLVALIGERIPQCTIAWTATDGMAAIKRCLSAASSPNLLMLDLSLEGLQGPSVCRRIRRRNATTIILGITSFSLEPYRRDMRDAGAQGVISKNDASALTDAIIGLLMKRTVFDGFESPMAAHARIIHEPAAVELTPREEQLMEYIAATGASTEELSRAFGISQETVRKHTHNIIRKLKAPSLLKAVILWRDARRA